MCKKIIVILVVLYSFAECLAGQECPIIPKPYNCIRHEGYTELCAGDKIHINDDRLSGAAELFKEYIHSEYGISLCNGGRKSRIKVLYDDSFSEDAYELIVQDGSIVIKGKESGCLYGLISLGQIMDSHAGSVRISNVSISDKARFGYRGLMLDTARYFYEVDYIKKILDLMASYKLNVFHWHLTDDQGWRVEIKAYPELTKAAAWRNSTQKHRDKTQDYLPNGGYYSQEDVKDVVAYAAARNIMVIPEFEMPGHAKAALSVYPSLACVNKNYSKNEWGVFPDLFCAGKEEVYTFIRNVLDEIIGLFPGKYIHIGGDEAKKTVWEQCPHCQALMRKMNIRTENDLQGYFVSEIARYINAKGKMVLGWDEILESSNIPDMTVMSWRGVDGGIKAAQLGYDAIMSPYTYMYLDYYQSSERQFEPYAHGGCLPLEKVYGYEPRPSFLSPEQAGHIKGVQGNLWTEYIHSENNADYMLFPRLLAVSEVAWSSSSSKDYQDFLTRLKPHLRILDEHNVLFRIPEAKIWVDRAENGDEFLCLQAPVDGSSLVYSLESADLETYGISSGQETLKIEIKTSLKEVNYVVQLPSGRRSSTYTYKLNK